MKKISVLVLLLVGTITLAADYTKDLGAAKVRLHADYSWRASVPTAEYNYVANPQNQAIIDATLPLLLERGTAMSTREIAQLAGTTLRAASAVTTRATRWGSGTSASRAVARSWPGASTRSRPATA